ncbi:MAG: hypothetical protein M3Z56_05980, partial [Bacteroidota bacterium]|nr:hypothetical protein [Bacteroidota bacterium]
MKYRWMILLFFIPLISLPQQRQIDSLKKVIPSLRDSARIDCLNALSEAYIYLRPDTAKMYALKAYDEALKNNYFRGMAKSFSNRGYIEAKATSRYQLAESYGKKAIELYEKTDDKKGLAHAYVIWSFALMCQGFYDSSIKGDIKVIQLCQKINYKVDEARATTMIGINYLSGGNYTKAFEYCMNGLKVARQSKDSERITISLTYVGQLYGLAGDFKTALAYYFESLGYAKGNILLQHPQIDIGNIYYLQKRYDSALFYYNQYIDTVKSITTDTSVRYGYIMDALTRIGETFLAKKEYDTALAYFKEPLYHSRKLNDQSQIMEILFDIAGSYYGKKNYKAALSNAQGCLQLAEKFKAKQLLRDCHQLMFSIYDQFKQTDSAYFHYRQYMNMKDSVDLEAFNRKMDLYKAASEDEKKQTQIKVLSGEKLNNQQQLKLQQQQIKSEALWKNILIAGILILLL